MKKFLPLLFLFSNSFLFSQGYMGLDIGQPIDPTTGDINSGTDTAIIGATCTNWVRVNFILGPWSSPNDQTLHSGRTWYQAYSEIIDKLVARGIQVYGLIGAEAYSYPAGMLEQYPGNDSAGSVAWIQNYAANFVSIVDMFKDRVRVFESYNEPNNWTNSNTAIVHPAWFALMLQELYLNTKYFNGHDADPAWQVTLVSGALFTFDLNSGGQYINDTYWYGKNVFAWDWTMQQTGSYPLDGFGQHIYVEQGSSNVTQVTNAMNNNLNDFWTNIYVYETDPNKKIWVSEFGWESGIYGEQFQSDNLSTGFNVITNDARVALGIWFTQQDFPGGDWGLYYMGNFQPSDRKIAYYTFSNMQTCPAYPTSVKNNDNENSFQLNYDGTYYFLVSDLANSLNVQLKIINDLGQTVRINSVGIPAGKNSIRLDTENLGAGMYFVNAGRQSFKMVLR
ncbi:MAG TPA: hypothetical protein VI112_15865 [Bacteroidia bacterium]|jgi:hypothetical protein